MSEPKPPEILDQEKITETPQEIKPQPSAREQLRGFSKKTEQEQIQAIRSLKDFGKDGLSTATELLNDYEHDLAGKRGALVGQFENILKLQSLRAELQAPPNAKVMMEEYIKAQKLLSEIGRQLDFDQEVAGRVVATARTALEETFRSDPELWAEYEQQVKSTDLTSVGEAHNAVFIHNFVGGSREDLAGIKGTGVQTKEDMRTRFELIAGLEPTLSCSTIQRGDTSENIFGSYSKVGVILKGGTIEDADYGDAGSTQVDAKTRVSQSRMDRSAPLSQKVVDAIAKRGNGYNELIVRDPKVAGIFINYDRVEEGKAATRLSPEELSTQEKQIEEALSLATEYNLPIYWMEVGKMKRYDGYDPATRTFKPHREEVVTDAPDYLGLPYDDIKDSPFSPSLEQKKKMTKNTVERNILQNVPEELRKEIDGQSTGNVAEKEIITEHVIARSKEQLPPLKEGHARVVHLTSPDAAEGILQTGLDYEKYGMLESTARTWQNESEVEYSTTDPRFAGSVAVVFDVPINELRIHRDVARSPGVLDKKYIVGIVEEKE